MPPISYACHQFPPVIIQHAARLDLRFTLSHRDVEDLLAERGLAVSHETVRRWVLKFGPAIARRRAGSSTPDGAERPRGPGVVPWQRVMSPAGRPPARPGQAVSLGPRPAMGPGRRSGAHKPLTLHVSD